MAETQDRIGSPRTVTRYVPNNWDENSQSDPQVSATAQSGLREVKAHIVTYKDGSVEEWVLNGDGNEARKLRDLAPNEAVQKQWNDAKKTAQTQADQAERKITGVYTGAFPEGHPMAGQPATVTTYADGPPKYAEIDTDTKARQQAADARAESADTRGQNADERAGRSEDRAVAAVDRSAAAQEDANKRGWAEIALRAQSESRLSDAETAKLRNGEIVTTKDGKLLQIQNDSSGKAVVNDITPKDTTKPASDKTFPAGTMLGHLSDILLEHQKELMDKWGRGEITRDQATEEMDRWGKAAQGIASEQDKILGVQQTAHASDVTQRGNTLTDDANRRTYASNAMDQAIKFNDQTAKYMPASARGDGSNAFLGQLILSTAMAGAMGGLKQRPEIPQPAGTQQLLGQGLGMPVAAPPATTNIIMPQAPAAPSAGSLVPLSTNLGTPLTPIPGGGFLPPGNGSGLSFTGGQLRAPGVSNDVGSSNPDIPDPNDIMRSGFGSMFA